MNCPPPMLRPFVEKFQSILQAGDFLDKAVSGPYENRAFEHPIAHQILQVETTFAVFGSADTDSGSDLRSICVSKFPFSSA